MQTLGISFFDIEKLKVKRDLKDELTIAFLHGLDLTTYLTQGTITFEVLREIRLCLEHEVPLSVIDANLDESILKALRRLYSSNRTLESSGLERYFVGGYGALEIEVDTFAVLVDYVLQDVEVDNVDFSIVPVRAVKLLLSAKSQKLDIEDLVEVALKKDVDYLEFMISLRLAGISIKPFLKGLWTEEQVVAVLKSSSTIAPIDLVRLYISENFTAGQIEQVVRSIEYNCVDDIVLLDEDGYPIYNEYQMYNIVEGARFGLNYSLYLDPMMSDYEMSVLRCKLMDRKDALEGIRSKLSVAKPIMIKKKDGYY